MKKDNSYTYYDSDERIAHMMCKTLDKYIMKKIILPYKKSEKIIDMHAHTNYSKDGNRKTIIDPATAPIVKRLFDLYLQGKTFL